MYSLDAIERLRISLYSALCAFDGVMFSISCPGVCRITAFNLPVSEVIFKSILLPLIKICVCFLFISVEIAHGQIRNHLLY